MTYQEAMQFINGFTKSGKPVKDLSRIAGLLHQVGNPEKKLQFIHIAGTNGKALLRNISRIFLSRPDTKRGHSHPRTSGTIPTESESMGKKSLRKSSVNSVRD